jgi:hypothetical protein
MSKLKWDGQVRTMTLVPPASNCCQECAAQHDADLPHKPTLYYQMRFYQLHGREWTWLDAMAHCSPEMQALWRAELTAKGVVLPEVAP